MPKTVYINGYSYEKRARQLNIHAKNVIMIYERTEWHGKRYYKAAC